MIKKIINILIVMSMLFNCTSFAMAVTEKELEKSQATQVLLMLDIINGYEDNTLKLDKYITRAETAAIIIRIAGLENAVKWLEKADKQVRIKSRQRLNKIFNDVSTEHWAIDYIDLAYWEDIVKGVGDKKFKPDDNITYEDLVTMIVRTLGYEHNVRKIGDYPEAYLSVAKDIGILEGVNLELGDFVKRSDASQMIFNCLTIELMAQVSGLEPKWIIDENSNLLVDRLEIDRNYGKIDNIEEGNVFINDTVYKKGPTNAEKYRGFEVCFYYVENEKGEKTLLILEKKT